MSESPVYVNLEFTPNPNTLKFVVNRTFVPQGAVNFTEREKAAKSPLAKKLFAVDGVEALLVGNNFVTITKTEAGNWDTLADAIPQTLEDHLKSGDMHFDKDWVWETQQSTGKDSSIENKIIAILDSDIRPAVAMDGGDITFDRYENGTVYLHLQGACSSCPSSIMTLKQGVETRLKKDIPEIKEVVQI